LLAIRATPIRDLHCTCYLEATVDNELYRTTIVEMEKNNVNAEYIQGWVGGFMGNPKREEQRLTEAYEKGFEDGSNQDTASYQNWITG
jgi:hypothetical protein